MSEAKRIHITYKSYFDKAGINTNQRLACFFGQAKVESNLKPRRESLNYSVEALLSTFGRHRISEADARKFGRTATQKANQVEIANRLYGGEWGRKNLGNTKPTDPYMLRGGGGFQITGRTNYEKLSKDTGIDFVNNPDLLLKEKESIIASIWFWNDRKLNDLADKNEITKISKVINLGNANAKGTPIHLDKRIAETLNYKKEF